jgi:thymidylate synthase ThyX
LPLCHMTRWRWSGSLDAFMNMLNLRLDPHTQSQTRLLAGLIADSVKQAFPVSYAAYVEGDV